MRSVHLRERTAFGEREAGNPRILESTVVTQRMLKIYDSRAPPGGGKRQDGSELSHVEYGGEWELPHAAPRGPTPRAVAARATSRCPPPRSRARGWIRR